MPEVVELREVSDRRDLIHRAVQRLSAGELVILPSEAGYVLAGSALAEGIGGRLIRPGEWATLLLRSADEILDFLPHLPPAGVRIARRCWPGPLVLRAPANSANGFLSALPVSSVSALVTNGQVDVRVSSHAVLSEVAKLMRGPLIVHEVAAPTKSTDFATPPWSAAALIVQETTTTGTNANGSNSSNSVTSIVRIDAAGHWSSERIGAIPENKVQRAACVWILFCCTGNTCRSPMAEALCRQLLAQRLRCSPQELTNRGYLIASAGLAADHGSPASPEAVEVLKQRGIDLKTHNSQPLTDRLLEHADRCYTMTNSHRQAILESHPELADRVQVLARNGRDILDPIGSGISEYHACAASIERHLHEILDEILSHS